MKSLLTKIMMFIIVTYYKYLSIFRVDPIDIALDTVVTKTNLNSERLIKLRDGLNNIISNVEKNPTGIYWMSSYRDCVLGQNLNLEGTFHILSYDWYDIVKAHFGVAFPSNAVEVLKSNLDPIVTNVARLFCGAMRQSDCESYIVTKEDWLKAANHVLKDINALIEIQKFKETNLTN